MKKFYFTLTFCFILFFAGAQSSIFWSDPIDISISSFGNSYPRIVLNGNGDPLVTWGGGSSVYFSKMEGGTFAEPLKLNDGSTPAYVANWTGPELASQGDTIYTCFMRKDWGGKTYLIRSFDGGNNFSEPFQIENYQDSASRFPSVVINEDGNPLVAIMKMDKSGHDPNYVIRKSEDFGETFLKEENLGLWSSPNSEACDCCPASIKRQGETIAVFYRDNNSNIRDIWTTLSLDGGNNFVSGFPVDNNKWQIFSCPSSGPDGIIIDDKLYAVFLSNGKCYMSRSSIDNELLEELLLLGDQPLIGSQNFPRIDNYNNSVAVTWRGISGGPKLFVSYSDDINNEKGFIQDTVYFSSFSSSDIALYENEIHLVWADSGSGVVKYMKGEYSPVLLTNNVERTNFKIYPNPASSVINIESETIGQNVRILGMQGELYYEGKYDPSLDISHLGSGVYLLELEFENNQIQIRKLFKY